MKQTQKVRVMFAAVIVLAAAMTIAIINAAFPAFAAQNGMDIKESSGVVVTGSSRSVYYNCPASKADSSYDVCLDGNEMRLTCVKSGNELDQWLADLQSVNPDLTIKYIWSSSDTSVADVSDSGKVQIYKDGTAVLTCTAMADYGQVVAHQDNNGNYYIEKSNGDRVELYKSANVQYTFTDFSDGTNVIVKDENAPDTENFPENGHPGAVEINKTAANDARYSKTGVTRVGLSVSSYPGEKPIDIVLVIDVSRSMTDFQTDYAMIFFKSENIGSSVDSPRAASEDGTYQYFEYYIPAEYKTSLDSGNKIPVYQVNPNGQDTIAYDIQYSSGRQNRGYNLYRHGESTSLNRQTDIANILNFNGAVYQSLSTFDAEDEAIKNYTKLNEARDSAASFVTSLLDASPKSRIALVQFADDGTKNTTTGERYAINSRIVSPFTNNKDELLRLIYNVASDDPTAPNYSPDRNAVDGAGLGYTGYKTNFTPDEHVQMEAAFADKGITLSNYGGTNYGLGMLRAEEVLMQDAGTSSANDRRMVVFMTDGEPSTLNLRYSPSGAGSLLSDEQLDEYRSNSVFNRNNYSWAYISLRRPLEAKTRLENLGYDIVTVGFDIDNPIGVEYFANYSPNVGYNYYLTNERYATSLYDDLVTRLVHEGMTRQEAEALITSNGGEIFTLRKQILKNLASYENGAYFASRDDQTTNLEKVYEDLAESLVFKTTDAAVSDVIADDYELRLLPITNGTSSENATIEITARDRTAAIDTNGNVTYTDGDPYTVELVTFSGSTLADGITVTDKYLDENGVMQTRNLGTITSENYTVNGKYFTYNSTSKTFNWTIGDIVNQNFVLSYDAYLTDSDPQYEIDMGRVSSAWSDAGKTTDADFSDEADTLNTNDHADIIYNNYLNRDCKQVFPKPTLDWENTSVTVTKVWNGTTVEGAKVQLRKSADGGTTWSDVYVPQTIGTTADWSYTWDDLPLYEDGVELIYSVQERNIDTDTYAVSYSPDGGIGTNITITNTKKCDVTVKYVDTNNVEIADDEQAYSNTPYNDPYNVRNVGSNGTDYLRPVIEKGGKTYYYDHTDTTSGDPESGNLTGDKTVIYVYDVLEDPKIEKKIELADKSRVESNLISVDDKTDDYYVKYVLTVTNPNDIAMSNVTVTDKVPDGLTFVSADNSGECENGVVSWTIASIDADGSAEVSFTAALTAETKNGTTEEPIKNKAVITGAQITPVDGEASEDIDYNIASNEVETTTKRTYSVTTRYVDTDGKELQDENHPYVDADEKIEYNVRNVGTQHTNYFYPTLSANGKTYYFLEFGTPSDAESGTLDSDKEIVYVYDVLKDPTIEKAVSDTLIAIDKQDGTYNLTYTLTVKNPNRKEITNVGVMDDIPAGLTFVSSDTGTHSDGVVSWTIDSIAANSSASVSYTVKLDDKDAAKDLLLGSSAPYYNTAYVTEMTITPDSGSQPVTKEYASEDGSSKGIESNRVVTTVYNGEPDLVKTADKSVVSVGENVVFPITATNTARTPLYDVVITDAMPKGMTARSATIEVSGIPADFSGRKSTVTLSADGKSLSADIACLGIGGTATITVNAVVDSAETEYVNTAKLTEAALTVDGNDIIEEDITSTVTLDPANDPFIAKTVDKPYARKGETLRYTLTVTNPVNHDIYNAAVTDVLPQGLELVADSISDGGVYDAVSRTITWSIDKIAKNGGTKTLTFEAAVASDSMNTLVNNCTLVQGVLDVNDDANPTEQPTVYNKTDSAQTEIIHDPSIAKSRNEAIAGKGEAINYTLTATNPDEKFDMHDVIVTDTLPNGLRLAAIQASDGTTVQPDADGVYTVGDGITAVYNENTRTVTWTISNVASGEAVTLKFRAEVIYTDTIDGRSGAIWENTAYITEATPDVDNDDEPDGEYKKEYPGTNHSETVSTDTKYDLVIEYRAETTDGRELDDPFNAGGNRGTEYDYNDIEHVPDTIVETAEDGSTKVWVKRTIVKEDDLDGVYDSDKKIIVVYDEFDSRYSIRKQVRTEDGEWQDHVQVMPGTTVYFRILVANNTNLPITDLELSDEMLLGSDAFAIPTGWASALDAFPGTLAGKETWPSSEMSFDVPEDAAADSRFVNIATVKDKNDPNSGISDHADVTVLPSPELSITKTAVVDEDEYGVKKVNIGQRVAFAIVVTNTGNTTLTNVNVSDDTYEVITVDEAGNETPHAAGTSFDVIASLAPNEQANYLVYFDVPSDVFNGEEYNNWASAKTYEEDGETVALSDTDDDTVVVDRLEPILSIVKTADKTHAKPGEKVSYTIVVYNNGETDAENVYVADYMLENGEKVEKSVCDWAYENGWVIDRVPAHGSVSVTTEPIEWPMPLGIPMDTIITNIAELYDSEESFEDGDDPIDEDDVDVTTDGLYAIETTKAANVSVLRPGETAGYVIYVTNKSNAALTDITVTESLDGTWGTLPDKTDAEKDVSIVRNDDNTLTVDVLESGDSVRLTFDYVIPEDTEDNQDITNTVTAEADDPEDPENDPISDSSDAPIRIIDDVLVITKTANCEMTYPGSTVVYTITVTNTGDKELENVVVTDDKNVTVKAEYVKESETKLTATDSAAADVDASLYDEKVIGFYPKLAAGECRVISVEYVIPENTETSSTIVNTATATDDNGHEESASDDVDIIEKKAEPTYKLEIVKTANVAIAKAGDTVTYTITVTNSGTGDLHNVAITDSLPVIFGNTTVAAGKPIKVLETLAAGKSESVIVNYTLPNNFSGKSLLNTATADSDETEPVKSNVTVTIEKPEIKITKTVSSQRVSAGERVYYTLTVTNTGNIKLNDLLLSDAKVGYSTKIDELDIGETWTTPANVLYYTFASDAAGGTSFDNTASVSNGIVKAASSTCASVTSSGTPYYPNVPKTGDSAAAHSGATAIAISAVAVCAVTVAVIVSDRRKRRHA